MELLKKEKAYKWLNVAEVMAYQFSKDPNTQVGCIILADNTLQVLSVGYNGFPRGIKDTDLTKWTNKETKNLFVEHAERNAIYNATLNGISLNGSICIITMFPCCDCARAIIQCGIKEIYSPELNEKNYTLEKLNKWMSIWLVSIDFFNKTDIKIIWL